MKNEEPTKEQVDEWCRQARPASVRFAKLIAERANKSVRPNLMGPLIASMTFQTVAISVLAGPYEPGSPEGLAQLRDLYHQSLKDAEERWMRDDLKQFSRRRGPVV